MSAEALAMQQAPTMRERVVDAFINTRMGQVVTTGLVTGAVALGFGAEKAQANTVNPVEGTGDPIALAASANEGSSGNNVVCGGVATKAVLMRLVKGGADTCGHRDIDEIWGSFGITPQVARTMHSGTVCSSDGMISQGRQHSPNPSKDKRMNADGASFYRRPLSVWGATCYSAWVGEREDGKEVAVLKGCGNGETTKIPPTHRPPKPPKRPPVLVKKHALTAADQLIQPTPTDTFHFSGTCKSGHRQVTQEITYRGGIGKNESPEVILKACNIGSVAVIKELPASGPDTWEMLTDSVQKIRVRRDVGHGKAVKHVNVAVFKDRQVPKPPTPPNAPVTPPVTPPPAHGCEVSVITDKTGRTVEATIGGDGGSRESINWGDGATSSSLEPVVDHTYNNDGAWPVTVHEQFPDGGTADCSTVAVTQQEHAPAPPAP